MNILYRIALIFLIFSACGHPPSPPPPIVNSKDKEVIDFELVPYNVDLYPIAIQFLIDDSTSIDYECNGIGLSRYDFVNFVFDVFRVSPEASWKNLYVGASSFGDKATDYLSLIDIQQFNSAFQTVGELNGLGTNQNFSDAIQKSINDLYSIPVESRYLIVVTDGKFSNETPDQAGLVLQQIANDRDFHVFTALFCPDFAYNWDDMKGVEVFDSLDKFAIRLFNDLDGYLPANSILASPENSRIPIVVHGFYTSSTFLFWNGHDRQKIKIADPIISDFWEIETGDKKDIAMLPVSSGCPNRTFNLIDPLPVGSWLLFVKRGTFKGFDVSITTSQEKVEIINGIPSNFYLEITSKDKTNLKRWEDCFSAQITWTLSDGSGNGILINNNPCVDIQHICLYSDGNSDDFLYSEVQWTPNFHTIGKVKLTVNLDAKSGEDGGFAGWQGSPPPFDVKIKPLYKGNSTSALDGKYFQKEFVFEDVFSPNSIALYLVSNVDTETFKEKSCPFPTSIAANPKVYKVDIVPSCNMSNLNPNKDSVCATSTRQDTFSYAYTFVLHSNVTNSCYEQLYFDWQSDINQKDTLWKCDNLQGDAICTEEKVKPQFLP